MSLLSSSEPRMLFTAAGIEATSLLLLLMKDLIYPFRSSVFVWGWHFLPNDPSPLCIFSCLHLTCDVLKKTENTKKTQDLYTSCRHGDKLLWSLMQIWFIDTKEVSASAQLAAQHNCYKGSQSARGANELWSGKKESVSFSLTCGDFCIAVCV